jgi:hypothetical protein
MAAFGSNADIECRNAEHKKARHKTGLSILLVAGARLLEIADLYTAPFRLAI